MVVQLQILDEEILHEHVFERYIELESHLDELKQDLGVFNKSTALINIDIEPPHCLSRKRKIKKRNRNSNKNLIDDQEKGGFDVSYNLCIEQSITSLFSSQDNCNSTTGYVLWSTTPFFLRWLLYGDSAQPLRSGGTVKVTHAGATMNVQHIPNMLTTPKSSTCIIELGGGISGILPVVLGNHVNRYICTDQKGILSKMKFNIRENLSQLSKRRCVSNSMNINLSAQQDDTIESIVNLEVMHLDWETFQLPESSSQLQLQEAAENSSVVYIIAMDVIYNEFLIDPFLTTVRQLLDFFQTRNVETHCLFGIHLRAQEVVTKFLEKAIIDYQLPIHYIEDPSLDATRFSLYYI